jgi:hypothetical protein
MCQRLAHDWDEGSIGLGSGTRAPDPRTNEGQGIKTLRAVGMAIVSELSPDYKEEEQRLSGNPAERCETMHGTCADCRLIDQATQVGVPGYMLPGSWTRQEFGFVRFTGGAGLTQCNVLQP